MEFGLEKNQEEAQKLHNSYITLNADPERQSISEVDKELKKKMQVI